MMLFFFIDFIDFNDFIEKWPRFVYISYTNLQHRVSFKGFFLSRDGRFIDFFGLRLILLLGPLPKN